MKQNFLLFLLTISLLFHSCTTLVNSPKQTIKFSSYPSEAIVTINDKFYGVTPLKTSLKRNGKHFIKIELEGYQPYKMVLLRKFDNLFWGNILVGGLPGMIVDVFTGSMYQLTPNQVHAHFRSETGSLYKTEDDIFIGITLQPDSSWKKIGNLIRKH
jgi:hypothetical protein